MRNVIPGDHQILPSVILAAQDDMRVRVAGVVVIDGDPIELRAQILLHLAHQAPDERLKIVILVAILG